MTNASRRDPRQRLGRLWRIGWTIIAICLVQAVVCGLSILPVLMCWMWLARWTTAGLAVRAAVFSVLIVPSYILFAMCLMIFSAVATRVTGARTPPDAELRIADMEWPLLRWARYAAATHVVRLLAGSLFRASPIWTAYLRWNVARIGRRVYVNTLFISDHNLLDFGGDVVIGADVHLSGHTVEGGVVKTGGVRLGRNVTIGLGSVIDIDVDAGPDCQVGALSLVPKHTKLAARALYAGIPVRRIESPSRL